MYKNIVFDMGNVLIMFYPEKTLRKYLTDQNEIDAVMNVFYKSVGYRECDRGTMTYDELIDSMRDQLPPHLIALLRKLYVEQCFGGTEMPPFPEMYDLVLKLKENGYKTYLLSNAGFDFHDYSKAIPAIGLLDGVVISCEYKLLKPEPEIYETLFEKFSLDPAECVFIDDMQENIDGAAACGMDGICFSPSFEDVSVLKEKLRERGVKI